MGYQKTILVAGLMLVVFALPIDVFSEIIAEYEHVDGALIISPEVSQAQAFTVTGNHTVSEVQLNMRRSSGSTGSIIVELRSEGSYEPAGYYAGQTSRAATNISVDGGAWVAFEFFGGVPITPGRWWIYVKTSPGSDAKFDWYAAWDNPYGRGDDTMITWDRGDTWPMLNGADANFKVFGDRVLESTTTTVTGTPSAVAINGVATIEVEVRDSSNTLVKGPGTVSLSATKGSLDSTTLTLVDGNASTKWTAPAGSGTATIYANYTGHAFAGNDYQASNNQTTLYIDPETRGADVTLALNPTATTTRSPVTLTVTVRDSLSNLINGGTVSFSRSPLANSGTISDVTVPVVSGTAQTTWTPGNTTGTFTLQASYSGYNDAGASIIYGADSAAQAIEVDYTDVSTWMNLQVDPARPYVRKETWVIVEVRDSGNQFVPGGTVQLTAPSGTFATNPIALVNGRGNTKWTAGYNAGEVTISGTYQQNIARGNRYLSCTDLNSAIVVKDTDRVKSNLYWMSEWTSDYTKNPLPNIAVGVPLFTDMLTDDLNWFGTQWSNISAWEQDMKKSSKGGTEDIHLDRADFTFYSGHGNPNYFTFITEEDDKRLRHEDAYDSWGDDDAEWLALWSCKVLSNPDDWAKTMEGLHLMCGFVTNAYSVTSFPQTFGSFMIKETATDTPHTITQSWFLAGDQTHPNWVRQRVLAENWLMFDDYLWGQGFVNSDPLPTNSYVTMTHNVTNASPVANGGGPYTAFPGTNFNLTGALSTDADSTFLSYSWDLDLNVNSDDGDYDRDGVDEADDDRDVWGRRPLVSWPVAGTYHIRLMVRDDTLNVDTCQEIVDIIPPGPGAAPAAMSSDITLDQEDPLEIVDDYPPGSLPTQFVLPVFQLETTSVGYDEMVTIGTQFGVSGTAEIDSVGNYHMVAGDRELLVNKYSGNVMYVDKSRAYVYDPCAPAPGPMPDEATAQMLAQDFLYANNITCGDWVYDGVADIAVFEGAKGSQTWNPPTPIQRQVLFRREIMAMGQPYPVVGAGGRMKVMMDENGEVLMFTKICRQMLEGPEEYLFEPQMALMELHRLGAKAFMPDTWMPLCSYMEIDNVSLGYLERDFNTAQTHLLPVYVLDVTCEYEEYAYQTQVYLPALCAPPEAFIDTAPTEVAYGDWAAFQGSAGGGASPYSYEWRSDQDGLLSTASSFSTDVLTVKARDGQLLPHHISLKVTDYWGHEATTAASVSVRYAGDFNANGVVDDDDLGAFVAAWLAEPGDANYDAQVDLDSSDEVDLFDFVLFVPGWQW